MLKSKHVEVESVSTTATANCGCGFRIKNTNPALVMRHALLHAEDTGHSPEVKTIIRPEVATSQQRRVA